ncbi:retinitis pigmentosa 1-like 1 protein [Artibeus jamaicensis]|uniref:retinitis pigmentosa 1-like 1 protein n=1 Tax=Artibeus jamaicensis TaxID=9417 RepID=UPI00235AEF16|nr:retinitis pigmentosa 1-like 1 protein [Artibeus jamaicensis]XP_036991503.2 retinitis pigmentosa 1-like 1 protein [Artibeus jamaicensis]XP_036991504.2 retinitis pigmentosa 1-like 1 protein [Artibeus jamaicensis]XP_036991508.2 retinitis pigmentosa 1-like 1 protein [Artibeus jamaicensis]XP_053514114.1 retinitis pigmentosa 1-like 1 protein [Artibeus jamaicensis]XP_053514115.1 retinitis pigmentosa 1-like 1 protein [Artibeus jamaicensis]
MNSTPRDAQAPSYRECLLPSMARTPSVTQVTPAKKITFLKRGDPQFSGVRLAVHQRTFKSFGTLMDELSQRVPLSFGVRSVTTPRGLHGLSALEQLEDGGCYLCSDKKPPKTSSGPGRPQGGRPSTQQSRDVEGQGEAPGISSSRKNPKAPKKIMLVKNGDPRFQQTVVLSHRNTRSLSAFLSKASDLLHFPVRQVYTTSGKKVDSLKALLHSPPVLVCAGPESFRPLATEGVRSGTETLSGQTSRSKNGSWGPKARQSVIHSRSRSGSGPRQFPSLLEGSGLSGPRVSLHHAWMGPDPDTHPQDTPAQLGPLVASDDVEKKVHVNEDGSLSVEMKVRFHLLGNDMLLWSRRVSRAGALTAASGEGHPGGSSEPGTQALGTQEAACKEAVERGRWQPGSRYEIWMNPLYAAQGEGTAAQSRARPAPHAHSRGRWSRGVAGRKSSSKESVSPASSDRPPEGSEPNSSCCSRSPEGSTGSCDLHLSSRATSQKGPGQAAGGTPQAGGGPGPEGGGLGSRDPRCLKPRTQRVTGALSDSSASAGSHEESSERGERHQGRRSKTRAMTSPRKATRAGGPCSSTMNLSSLGNEDPWAEGNIPGPGHMQARDACGTRQPLASGCFGSSDIAEGCSLSSPRISATDRRRKQESRASAVASPSISGLGRGPQRGHLRQHGSRRDTHCPLDSPVCRQTQGPPSAGRGFPASPAPRFPGSSSSARNPGSQNPELPRSPSLHSQDAQGVGSAPLTAVSDSDCALDLCPAHSPFTETKGNPEFRAHSPCNSWDSLSSQANAQGENVGGDVPKPSRLSPLPVGQHKVGKSRSQQEGCYSETGISGVCRTPCVEMHAQPQGSPEPVSEALPVCSRHCPTPPRAQSSVKKHGLPHSSNRDHSAASGPAGTALGEEQLDAQCPRPPGSQSGGPRRAVRAARRGSLGARPGRMCQGQAAGGGDGLEEQEDKDSVTLGALPRASPEAVVREWLSNIPEEPEPVKYETVDDRLDMARDGLADRHSPKSLEEPTQARHPSLERATSEKAEPEGPLPVTGDAGPQPGEGLPHSGVSEAPVEARAGEVAAGDCAVGQRVLPHRVSASVQVMKALLGSRQGQAGSLPEVSGSAGRRLSHSAQALIMCLTKLHFFDEDLGSSTSKVRFADSPRYKELLSTFQALWPRCGLRPGEQDSGLREFSRCQALPGLRSQAVTENFTPTSSSGVDVGSGSGGSGEGRGPCAVDCALVSERIDLPSKILHQRPDSRTSENPEELGRQQLSGCMASSSSQARACATRKGKAEGSSGEHRLGGNLDQVVESTMQEEAVQLAKIIEEEERAELQWEAVSGFPEEKRAVGQELSGARSQEEEGARDDESVQEEEAGRDLVSAMLRPAGRGETTAETLGSLVERDSNATGSQSGPNTEPCLEELPRATGTSHEETQAKSGQQAGEKGSSVAHRVSLDPDPLWVSSLLRKMEKAFMAHLASATASLRARWSLQDHSLLDQMVAELQQDVGQRLQDSTVKELQKIQSRAGRRAPGPPRVALRWETSQQTEQRRHRLRGLRNLSAFSERTWAPGTPSLSLEDVPNLSGALGTQLDGKAKEEEFCPCEACLRKKVILASPKDTVGIASLPIKEAFDLQQILQKKKGGCASGETAGMTPKKTGVELHQRDPSGTGTVQGADGGLEPELGWGAGAKEGDEDEGSQTLSSGEDPGGAEEDAAAQKRGGNTGPHAGCHPEAAEAGEWGMGRREGDPEEGSGARSPGGQNDGADTVEVQKTEGEGQPTRRRESQGEKQAGPRRGKSGKASGHSSPDQERRPPPAPATGGDTRGQTGQKTGLSSSRTSSLGNCSQVSQKGSEEEPWNGGMRTFSDEPKGVPGSERKVTDMYPESSTSEQEGPSSGSRTPERGTGEGLTPEPGAGQGSDIEAEKVVKRLSGAERRLRSLTMDRTDGFGQDDLDF